MQLRKVKHPTHYFAHNKVTLLRSGTAYFETLHRLIREAKHSIYLQTYIFDEDETGIAVAEALIRAAQRKVDVFVLLDGYASQQLTTAFIQRLTDSGIRFRWFEPLLKSKHFYFGRRLHHKVVVIDKYRSLVTGRNISNRYNDMPGQNAWLDWAILTEGDVVSVLELICKRRMKVYTRHKKEEKTVLPTAEVKEECRVRVRVNDWVQNKRQISTSYLEMLRHASSHLIIMSPYFLPGNELRKQMARAAKRGVKIKVILSGVSDVAIVKWAERYVYQWLLRNRIEIHEYQKNVLHGKMATYDNLWTTIGSYNVNNLSAYASIELNLDVANSDFAKTADHELEKIIADDCVQITEEDYKKRNGFFRRMIHFLSYESLRLVLFLTTFYFKQRE